MIEKIKDRLINLMELNGITKAELARILEVGKSVVGYWCTGKTTPTAYYIIKICDYFNVCADYLLGRQDWY